MDHQEIKEHMAIARELAEEAGKISLEYFRKPQQVDDKMPGIYYDPVTEADKRIEEKLREGLAKHFPGYSILGEEYGSEGDNDLRWVIDPIDGTRAFISGVTGWGVLLGLTDGDRCLGDDAMEAARRSGSPLTPENAGSQSEIQQADRHPLQAAWASFRLHRHTPAVSPQYRTTRAERVVLARPDRNTMPPVG